MALAARWTIWDWENSLILPRKRQPNVFNEDFFLFKNPFTSVRTV